MRVTVVNGISNLSKLQTRNIKKKLAILVLSNDLSLSPQLERLKIFTPPSFYKGPIQLKNKLHCAEYSL